MVELLEVIYAVFAAGLVCLGGAINSSYIFAADKLILIVTALYLVESKACLIGTTVYKLV